MKHLYFVPGLAANPKIFERLEFPEEAYQLHFLEWKIPTSSEESISDYAKRMCEEVQHEHPVLIGVSFGGVMVQEMSKHIATEKIIIISSIKNSLELPKRLQLAKMTKAYKLLPTKVIINIEDHAKYFLGDYLQKRAELYKMYLSVRDPLYLHWALHNVLHWTQTATLEGIVHIHGTEDNVFPIKHIKNAIRIEKGTHVMILTKAKTIATHIHKALTC